jgi:hypothetical protein
MGKIVDAVWSTFVPFSRNDVGMKAVQGKAEYGTGLVVSADGHIVTPRHVTDGCAVIVIAGLGNAEAVADDQAKGLALLRVYGDRRLVPLPLTGEAASGRDLNLVGVADPKAQAGGSGASTARARLATASGNNGLRALDGAPGAGFSGAAALDGSNRLFGMLQVRPQLLAEAGAAKLPPPAALIPAESLREFLAMHGVPALSGSTTANEAKASVVRVICVRK